jgi:uncharacterized coiled-coil protein SlyX
MIEQWKMVDKLEARLDEMEAELKSLKARNGESAA